MSVSRLESESEFTATEDSSAACSSPVKHVSKTLLLAFASNAAEQEVIDSTSAVTVNTFKKNCCLKILLISNSSKEKDLQAILITVSFQQRLRSNDLKC
jgi:hypothetical protein